MMNVKIYDRIKIKEKKIVFTFSQNSSFLRVFITSCLHSPRNPAHAALFKTSSRSTLRFFFE